MSDKLTLNAIKILKDRYLEPDETIDQLWERVSGGNPEFKKLLLDLDFLPNSPTLMNRGTGKAGTLSACFVLNPQDTMLEGEESIMGIATMAAAVAKWGGGVGYYLGHLRPKGDKIQSTHKAACGPVAVLKFYNEIGKLITQGGRRDMAQMGILPITHKDIREFIHVKDKDPQSLRTFNISVSVTDDFMKKIDVKGSDENRLWNEIVESAWKTGDPGLMFHDTVNKSNVTPWLGPILASNPCVTGDTKVYVADGRTSVSIKQLAEEGKDVPVFCLNGKELAIRMMRNPRLTGNNQPIYKVTLDDGYTTRVTGNHKFRLRNGELAAVNDLKPGDSLHVTTRYIPESCDPVSQGGSARYISIHSPRRKPYYEHVEIAKFASGRDINFGEHVHHINEDRFDNRPNNLSIDSGVSHLSHHSLGEANPRFSGASNEQLLEAGRKYTKELGRRFSCGEWEIYAKANGLPSQFSEFRIAAFGTVSAFSKRCAVLEGFGETADINQKTVRLHKELLAAGLDAEIVGKEIVIHKNCKKCGKLFIKPACKRETAFCSLQCSAVVKNHEKAKTTLKVTNEVRHVVISEAQLNVFTVLKNKLGRVPMKKEWVKSCKESGVSFEVSKDSSPFKSWDELVEAGSTFNHRVVSVELDGYEDVYNGTVDDFHNFYVGGWDGGLTNKGRRKQIWICNANCGEQFMESGNWCLLGSINLANFVNSLKEICWDRLAQVTRTAIYFLNDILSVNTIPHDYIKRMGDKTNRIGLGVMGWADMLALLHIHYDSDEAITLAEKVMKFINYEARDTSIEIGKVKGPYPESRGDPAWNAYRTTAAPTGTISIIAGCSSGIEPHYALEWTRTINAGVEGKEDIINEKIPVWDRLDGFKPKVANQIDWKWHVKHQAAFQKHIDNSVSKTINLPNSATKEDISNAYKMLWETGCKGGTVFRDGCRSGGQQVLKSKDSVKPSTKKLARERNGTIYDMRIGDFEGYLHVGLHNDGSLREIFITSSKAGSTVAGLLDTWAISVSYYLQKSGTLDKLVKKYSGTRFEPQGITNNPDIPICTSIPDYVVRLLDKKYGNGKSNNNHKGEEVQSGMICPDCQSMAIFQGGCLTCKNNCGWSKCG